MKCIFKHKRVSAVVSVVPREEYRFDDEYPNYKLTEERARRFKKMMSLDRHRIAPPEVTSSDLCGFGLASLLKDGIIRKEEVGALIFVSQTPDYFIPPTSNVLHGKFGFGPDVQCFDINQGCAGFPLGLMQAFMLLELLPGGQKVLLLNGDTCSKQLSRCNRISYPLAGDAGSVAVVERCAEENLIYMDVKHDGSRHQALMVPAGAYRQPSSPETMAVREVEEGVMQSLEHIHMDGPAVFNFTMTDVPAQIEEVLKFSGETWGSIQHFLLHQPNPFILKQMADKLNLTPAQLPGNVVGIYGNCSSVSIPLNIALNCGEALQHEPRRVLLSGFGTGLTWISMVLSLGPLTACKIIDYAPA
jgi:3-oxoacyl-[acyl-carrier-protein] synthase-3